MIYRSPAKTFAFAYKTYTFNFISHFTLQLCENALPLKIDSGLVIRKINLFCALCFLHVNAVQMKVHVSKSDSAFLSFDI